MELENKNFKKKKIRVLIGFALVLCIIVLNMVIHVVRTDRFNRQDRSVTPLSASSEVLVNISPRGKSSDSWEKNDAFPDRMLYAKIYNANIDNCTSTPIQDWSLRIDIKEECFVNSAWNGTVEIHQFRNGQEQTQEIYFLDYAKEDIELDYIMGGQDVLITLEPGDYIIYHPDTSEGSAESTVSAIDGSDPGEVIVGFIFYTYTGNMDMSGYELDYHMIKDYFSGLESYIFFVLSGLWIISLVIYLITSATREKYQRAAMIEGEVAENALKILADQVESKEACFKGHAKRCARYSGELAEKMGLKPMECRAVYYCALVHDIGNLQTPDYILKKSSKLTNEEYATLKRHTVIGADMLETFARTPGLANAARYHHEWFDGSGYPEGKKGEEIPLVARLVAVTDAYCAMTEKRPYREALTRENAISQLILNSGKQFDPLIAEAMVEMVRQQQDME